MLPITGTERRRWTSPEVEVDRPPSDNTTWPWPIWRCHGFTDPSLFQDGCLQLLLSLSTLRHVAEQRVTNVFWHELCWRNLYHHPEATVLINVTVPTLWFKLITIGALATMEPMTYINPHTHIKQEGTDTMPLSITYTHNPRHHSSTETWNYQNSGQKQPYNLHSTESHNQCCNSIHVVSSWILQEPPVLWPGNRLTVI